MTFEYHDVHSDFINLNATNSIHLSSNRIFINDINIVTSLQQLSSSDNTNTVSRLEQLESNISSIRTYYSNLAEDISNSVVLLNCEVNNIKNNVVSNNSILEQNISDHTTLYSKMNTVELVSNQLAANVKSYMESIDNISKRLKYAESNQVDIMSIMTRVITLENANKELVNTNKSLRKTMDENNNKIVELDDKLLKLNDKLQEGVSNNNALEINEKKLLELNDKLQELNDKLQKGVSNVVGEVEETNNSQPEPITQLSRAKSVVGRKNK